MEGENIDANWLAFVLRFVLPTRMSANSPVSSATNRHPPQPSARNDVTLTALGLLPIVWDRPNVR